MGMKEGFLLVAEIMARMAECPSAGYCLRAGRVECTTCPVRPEGVQRLVAPKKEAEGGESPEGEPQIWPLGEPPWEEEGSPFDNFGKVT